MESRSQSYASVIKQASHIDVDTEQFTKDGFKILMDSIKCSNSLPSGDNLRFFKSFSSFNDLTSGQSNRIREMMKILLRQYNLSLPLNVDDGTEILTEANDLILERAANHLDELEGIRPSIPDSNLVESETANLRINGSWNRFSRINSTKCSLASSTIMRPQSSFKDKIDNSNEHPWQPRITEKPNNLKPLAIFLEEDINGDLSYSHPYEFELDHFTPPESCLQKLDVIDEPKNISKTELLEVNTEEQLRNLVDSLNDVEEFAVDVEHHSHRTFMGITCLVQISTREKDYIIDTLALRDKLHMLNEVFTKPTIVKIFHGAERDVEWLQRDLSVYVVNMFDTFVAAKLLNYPTLSLAYLLKRYCNVVANKSLQTADWRVRPLPDEMKTYAREDTHYLIYIYQLLRNELCQKSPPDQSWVRLVFERCVQICKKRYRKPIMHDQAHLELYQRWRKPFDNRQMYAFKYLFEWRDRVARAEDESVTFVLPNHMLLQIAERLPREMQGVLACCNPTPPLLRSNLLEVHKILLKARDQPLEKPIMRDDTRARGTLMFPSSINEGNLLYNPHDLHKSNDFRDDLPTLLGQNQEEILNRLDRLVSSQLKLEKEQSSYSAFNTFYEKRTVVPLKFVLSPFERYKIVRPFVQDQERQSFELEKQLIEKSNEKQKDAELHKAVTDVNNDSRSDDDRIEAMRIHFLELNRKFKEREDEEIARKQKISEAETPESETAIPTPDVIEVIASCEATSDSLDATTSNAKSNVKKQSKPQKHKSLKQMGANKKRKVPFIAHTEAETVSLGNPNAIARVIGGNTPLRKRKQQDGSAPRFCHENKEAMNHSETHPTGPSPAKQQKLSLDVINTNSSHNNRHTHEVHARSNVKNMQQNPNKQQRPKQFGKWNKNKPRKNQNHEQSDMDYSSFNYSMVDFRQFQGGATVPQDQRRQRNRNFRRPQKRHAPDWGNYSSNTRRK